MEPQTSVQPDPSTQPASDAQDKLKGKIPVLYRIYGLYCFVSAAIVLGLIITITVLSTAKVIDLTAGSNNASLTFILTVIQFVLMGIEAVAMIGFGISLLRNRRRHAAQMAYALIAINIVGTLIEIMLHGFGENLIGAGVQLAILTIISVTVDPTLREERRRERIERDAELEREAKAGTLGRAKGDRGFIELDFFNLFWVFVVCCFLGLVIETVYHMVVVDPGVYQDRAGMLFGPFSPIYGFGAVLMTVALNRFYKSNFVVIFLVSAIIGGLFEAAVSWFMQTAFGAVAWDYTGSMLFGVIPDPVAALCGGRTSTMFAGIWGILGLVWIRLLLPRLLVPAVAPEADQPHPLEGALRRHDALRRLDAGERRHDARGARLLVPARIGLPAHVAGRGVLCEEFRRCVHGASLPNHVDGSFAIQSCLKR